MRPGTGAMRTARQSAMRAAHAHFAAHRHAEAQAALEALITLHGEDAGSLLLLATLRLAADADAAEALLRRCIALAPTNSQAWHYLGKVAEQKGDLAAAIERLRHAATLNPHFAPTHNDLGALLQQTGERDAALAALDRAIAIDPDYATAHHNRGMLLVDMRRPSEAREAFRKVLGTHLDSADAWHNVGAAHLSLEEYEPTVAACRQALALDAGHLGAYATLAQALGHLHRNGEATEVRAEWARRQGVVITPCRSEPAQARVLLLGAAEFCNVPAGELLDRTRFETISLNLMPPAQRDADPATDSRALPPVDIVFNAIGDADRGAPFFAPATEFCQKLGRPLLNPPRGVARTRRDALPALIKDIPGLVTPRIRRIARGDMAAFATANEEPGRPLLVRPAGSHGGDDLVRIEDRAELTAYAQGVPADDYYLSDFWDYRGADGLFRKYRLIFVDRAVFPYHLAITNHWLAHYWRAEMAEAMKREEAAFLADFRQAFRGAAADAVAEAARRLDLDYAGMDCTILPDGRVLVFEANAAMLVHLRESREAFAYKHAHVPRIIAAVGEMVLRRIAERRLGTLRVASCASADLDASACDIPGVLARDGDLCARRACHQSAIVEDGDEAEPRGDHARRIGAGRVVDSGEPSVPAGRRDELLVDRNDVRLLAIEHRLQAEREAEIARADIDAADPRHVENAVDVVDRLLGLDHRDDQHLVVGDRLVGAGLAVHHGTDRAVAALAGRRIEAGAGQGLRLLRGVHHRADHTPRAAVEHLADDPRLVPRHAHQRRHRMGVHRLKALHHRQVVLHAVLHIHGDAVEAALGHDLRGKPRRDRQPPIDAGLARRQACFELVHGLPSICGGHACRGALVATTREADQNAAWISRDLICRIRRPPTR